MYLKVETGKLAIQTRKRTGDAPSKESKEKVLDRTVAEVKCRMDAEQNVKAGVALTFKVVRECIDILKGAVSIVYPMGLPEYDPVRMELENRDESVSSFISQSNNIIAHH